jgi:hypothetical protein
MEIGIVGTGGNGSFYINKNVQVGEAGASIYIKKSDGFVGINNINPTFQLDVTGKMYSSTEIQANTAVVNTTGGYATFGSNTSSAPIRIGRNAASNDIIVAPSGNVLINNTLDNLSSRLQVNGASTLSGQVTIDTGVSQPLELKSTSNNQYLFVNSLGGGESMTQYYNPTGGNWYTGIRTNAGLGSTSSYHIYSSIYGNDVFAINTNGTAKFASTVETTGIKFPATQVASSDANTLDDYEEGTWTPTLPNGGSLVRQSARYVKVGQKVTVSFYVSSVLPTNNSSDFIIGGLPFLNGGYSAFYLGGSFGYVGTGNLNRWLVLTGINFNYVYFHANNGLIGGARLTNADYLNDRGDGQLIITITYFADT